jgi:PAS domain S-box-containing protein
MIQNEQVKEFFCDNWEDIIDKITEGLILVDLKGTILFVNSVFEELFQFSREELLGKSCDILECDNCLTHNTTQKGKRCSLFRDGDVKDLRCTFKQKNGQRVTVLKNATVLTDKNGKVVGGVETLTDLSTEINKEKVILKLRKELNQTNGFHGLIGNSSSMQQVYELIKSAAQSNNPIIIYGESGTGKELVANAIHTLSNRSPHPFVKLHCAALNENNLESELFGHTKGAFIGAESDRAGRFEAADSGSIFFDEIGDLPIVMQTKLLKVLQENEVERIGNPQPININVRIISATNKDLNSLMVEKKFREDLFYRIGVIPINIPPLRQHPEDIPLLVKTFINKCNLKTEKEITTIRKDALDLLINYHWPGNIRELINVIEYTFVLCSDGEITPDHLPQQFKTLSLNMAEQNMKKFSSPQNKRQQLLSVLKKTQGNKSKAAKILGVSRVTLWKHLKKHNITVDKSAY